MKFTWGYIKTPKQLLSTEYPSDCCTAERFVLSFYFAPVDSCKINPRKNTENISFAKTNPSKV